MYNSEDYINYQIFNEVEEKIETLTNYINDNNIATIPNFNKKKWSLNEIPYVEEVSRIEVGIDNLGLGLFKPTDWINTRNWNLTTTSETKNKNAFSYEDINRWLFNLNLIDNIKDDIINIWNGKSYIYWNESSDFEWE